MPTLIRTLAGLVVMLFPAIAIGQSANDAPVEVVSAQYGDWEIRCDAKDPSDCFMVLTGTDARGNPMVEMSLVRFAADSAVPAGATAVVPLGTALPEGLILQVDEGEKLHFVYDFCTPAGCVANLALTPEQLWAMKAGFQAAVTIAAAVDPEKPITILLSLKGFTNAFEALR